MASNFNKEKYKKYFESRYGKGSYESGLSSAREVGRSKAQAEYEKDAYKERIKAYEKAVKEAEKAEKDRIKRENNNPIVKERAKQAEKARDQGRGGRLPSREQQQKESEIQSEYKRTGQFPSSIQKELDNLETKKPNQVLGRKTPDPIQSYLGDNRYKPEIKSEKKSEKSKKDDDSFLDNLKGFLTGEKKFNIAGFQDKEEGDFDTTANKVGKVRKGEKPTGIDRFINRSANSVALGAYEEIAKKTDDKKTSDAFYSDRKFGEGGGTDFLADSLGYLLPGLGAIKAARGTRLGADMSKKGVKKALQLGKEGAVTGAGIAGAEVGVREALNGEDTSALDNLKHIGIGTATGAIADPALFGLGKGAKYGFNKAAESGFGQSVQGQIGKFAKGEVPEFTGKPSEEVSKFLPDSLRKFTEIPTSEVSQSNDLMERLARLGSRSENVTQAPTDELRLVDRLRKANITKEPYEAISAGKDPGLRRIDPSKPSLEETQNIIVDNPLDSFSSKVDRNPKKEKPFNNLLQRLQTNFTDDMTPLRVLEQNINGKVDSAENSLYKQSRLFRGSPAKANEIVRTELAPIIDDIQKKGYSYEDLGDYALAIHAKDVNTKGLNSGFTNQEIEAVIKKLGTPEMETARKQLMGVSDRLLGNLADAGVLSKESVEAMREKWSNYMPLFRSFDDEKVDFKAGLSRSLANVSSPIKKLEGSDRTVIDPIESMIKNIFQSTTAADRNTVAKQLTNLADKDTDNKFIRKLESNEDVGRKNVVSVMENGEKVKYEVPPDVYKTMLNMDRESSNLLIKILQKPASTLRAGATLTPEFSLRNPMRDVVQAYVVSNSGFNPITDFTYGLVQAIGKGKKMKISNKEYSAPGKLYEQFMRDNAGYGNIVSMDRNVHKKALEDVIKEGNTKKFLNVFNPNTYLDMLRSIADVSETATKLGEYRAALRKGVSRDEAAYRARDIMDFGRSGSSIREANKVVAFLNANIQGKSKLVRAIQDDWMGVTSRASKAVLLPTLGAFMAQKYLSNEKQQETIDDAPSWLKNSFWLVPVPGTDQVARIPKPFDLAPIFANLPEKTLEYFFKDNKEAFDGFAKETISSYSIPTMLTGLAPIVEGMANYSFFMQGRIIPQREDDIEYPDQHDINTSETAKFLGKGINNVTSGEGAFKNFGSPRIIDNSIRGFTGGLGMYATNAIDAILEQSEVVDKPEKADKLPSQQPIARSFLVNQGSTGASVGKLYDLLDSLKRARGTAKEKGNEFTQEGKYDYVSDVTKEISEISSKMREIENNSEYNGSEKRRELDKFNEIRNEIAREAVKELRTMR